MGHAGSFTWGLSLFFPICVLVLNSPKIQDDNPTPRPAVQAEDGISPEGKRGRVT